MHVPDGFINAPVSLATGAVAAAALAISLRGARREPAAGPATQMLNFPVAAGTSGHLLGGALAAILVGPFTGVLCLSVVLLTQSLLFADGGLTALGVNIVLMGVVTVAVAYGIFRALLAVLPRARRSVTAASFAAALISVPASAAAFTLLHAVGGTTDVPTGTVLAAMTGVHTLIGLGEGVITALTVGAVLAVRPDLVHGARGLAPALKLRVGGRLVDATTVTAPAPASSPASAASSRRIRLAGLAAALVLAGGVSFYASASPDGLEKVAADHGIDAEVRDHPAAGSPLADYGVADITDPRLSVGLAGVIGVGATAAVGIGLFRLTARRRRRARRRRPARAPETL